MDTIREYKQKHNQWQREMSLLQHQEPKTPEIEITNKRKHYKYRCDLSSGNFTLFLKVRNRWNKMTGYPIGYFLCIVQDRLDYKGRDVIPSYEQLTPLNIIKLRAWCKGLGLLNEEGEVAEDVYTE